jgi:tetratricopeptide (TPR) repeat protein
MLGILSPCMDPVNIAIQAAQKRDWKLAIEQNLVFLKQNPKDIDALNRLGRAYLETGQKTKANEIYEKVLKLDKYNPIAKKSLELIKTMRVHRQTYTPIITSAPIFLEEPGITKNLTLTRLGDQKIISRLHAGDPVQLTPREHCVVITTMDNEYLGRLPDDMALRMRSYLKAGNKYEVWIRAIDLTSLKIFIKEISRSTKFRNTPSFPSTEKMTYAAFTPPNLIYDDKPIVSTPEEDVIEENTSEPDDTDLPVEADN